MAKEKNDILSDEEFSDAPEAEGEFLDGDFDDEAWDDGDFAEGEGAVPDRGEKKSKGGKTGKKKSKLLPILAGGAVIVLVGLYMIGSRDSQPVTADQQAAPAAVGETAPQDDNVYTELQKMQQPSSEETPVLPQEAPKAVPKGDGFLNNPEKLSEVEQLHDTMEFEETTVNADGAEPPMPAPVQSGDAPIPRSPLTPMPSGETPPPLENAQAMPVIQNNSAETFPALLPKAQDIALDTSGSSAQTENPTSDKMTAELSQMNEMLSSLADRMGDLEDKVGALADSSVGAPTADLKEIKVALSKLEKRVNAMAEDSSSASHAFAPAASKAAPLKTAAQVPATKEWILKAAQPGRAIVTRAGSDETYAVSVGENLDGIGKISSVSQQDGKWVVQGASGKIVQ